MWADYSTGVDGPGSTDYDSFEENVASLRELYRQGKSRESGQNVRPTVEEAETYFEGFSEAYGEEMAERVDDIFNAQDGWARSAFNESTAPLWQLAAQDGSSYTISERETALLEEDVDTAAAENFAAYTQDVLQEELDGGFIDVYRGVKDGARLDMMLSENLSRHGLRQAAGEQVTVPHKLLESWTTDEDYAERLAEDGIVLQASIPLHRVLGAPHTHPALQAEQEVIVQHKHDELYTIGMDAVPQ